MSVRATTQRRQPMAYVRAQATPGNWLRDYGQPIKCLNTKRGPSLQSLLEPTWMRDAICSSVDPELWFQESDTSSARRAISLCRQCPVRAMCLASALVFREEYGISGGLTPSQRRPLESRLMRGQALGDVLAIGLRRRTELDQQGVA
ncbi:WhiB family transcriptional regulator [Terrabacter sp. NPDC080008]|uniref:WhiB family transcriptional regulator n=1 Tax=Terrabacter sp. NPDC080008 TaxID=3155176 RepID=UPI00344E9B09